MIHTVEELIQRINVMKDTAIMLHRKAEIDDQVACKQMLDDIQSMAYMIAKMETKGEVQTDRKRMHGA
jgi:hypothetical protein